MYRQRQEERKQLLSERRKERLGQHQSRLEKQQELWRERKLREQREQEIEKLKFDAKLEERNAKFN
jgi:hypothetical protein